MTSQEIMNNVQGRGRKKNTWKTAVAANPSVEQERSFSAAAPQARPLTFTLPSQAREKERTEISCGQYTLDKTER